MSDARQKQFQAMGAEGCLFFSMTNYAETLRGGYIDSLRAYNDLLRAGTMTERCYVNDIAAAFSYLTGQTWTCEKRDVSAVPAKDELEITRLEKQGTVATLTPFVCTDGFGNVTYDPLGADLSSWKAAKKYVFRRIA